MNGRGKFSTISPSLRQAMPLMPCIFTAAIFIEGRLVHGIVVVEDALDLRRALIDLAFQMIQQVADGQVRLADQGKIQGRDRGASSRPGWG